VLLTWMRVLSRLPEFALRPVEVNRGPGVMVLDGEQRLIGVWSLEISGNEIRSVSSIVNPDKLAHLGVVADFAALVRDYVSRPGTATDSQAHAHDAGGTP
jgi:RNA polymerase sigma-70 factor (ECF subfamily)